MLLAFRNKDLLLDDFFQVLAWILGHSDFAMIIPHAP